MKKHPDGNFFVLPYSLYTDGTNLKHRGMTATPLRLTALAVSRDIIFTRQGTTDIAAVPQIDPSHLPSNETRSMLQSWLHQHTLELAVRLLKAFSRT